MRSFLKTFSLSLLVLGINSSLLHADTFISPKSSQKYTSISPLTPFDEALKKEMQKYPKNSAFFVDGRTGKILSVNKLPNKKSITKSTSTLPQKAPEEIKKSSSKIPYNMQEERIELLQ